MPLAAQNLEQDEEVIGQESAVIGDEGRGDFFKLFLIDSRAPPARSPLRAMSHASRVPVQNSYRPSLFFKI
jgi:hypothetical protein